MYFASSRATKCGCENLEPHKRERRVNSWDHRWLPQCVSPIDRGRWPNEA